MIRFFGTKTLKGVPLPCTPLAVISQVIYASKTSFPTPNCAISTHKNNNNNNISYPTLHSSLPLTQIQARYYSTPSTNKPIPRKPFLKSTGQTYDEVYNEFKWDIPKNYNIGVDISDKHLPGRANQDAIVYEDETGHIERLTYAELSSLSNRLADSLGKELGVVKGDRVAILLSQGPATAIGHVAVYKTGGIAIPLFTLFGPEALEYRLNNSETKVVLTDTQNLPKLLEIVPNLPSLEKIVVVTPGKIGGDNESGFTPSPKITSFNGLLKRGSPNFKAVNTSAEDPAIIIFTSGTTGNPKGCLHAHRVLIGHLPGVEFPHNLFPQPQYDKLTFYTPADWAWIGGLIDVLLPALHHGVTVLAHRAPKFDAHKLVDMMARHEVRHAFMPPTALKLMRQHPDLPKSTHLYSIGSGGESLGDQLLHWGKETFGVTINEFYGQTEANLLVGSCSKIMPIKSGSMGRAIPGHTVEVISPDGEILPPNEVGSIAVKTPDPVVFLRYWNNEKATKAKFVNEWLVTGDLGKKDEDGYFWYVGRDDDIINSSGYRIGPSEIENCLLKHPSISMAAAIGAPDALRGEVVKAFIVLRPGVQPSQPLQEEIQNFVKHRLAAHEYPRQLEFVTELPMTTTGKIIRRTLRDREVQKIKEKK
eukprot:TRINITY_DN2421_c0_g1_i3.p1 TRINITY_DN2421_c0_g1~~TRINITY_DN2421_c0_g1_i3.p1  ORF type:complete len:646 (-),score=143.66 TRINITY_DN2421_c0_g1_i3:119-2056(-)